MPQGPGLPWRPFSRGRLVLIDDVNWTDPMDATNEFTAQSKHSYDVIAVERTFHNCHPTYRNGITLLQTID